MKTYSVLIVEDDEATRLRLADIIDSHQSLTVLGSVATCREARLQLDDYAPDVMLTDLGLPDGDGTDLIKEIPERGYHTEVMVITVFADEKHVLSAIEHGATGYLLKDGTDKYISDSILQLLDGGSPISPSIARHLLKRFTEPKAHLVSKSINAPKLTKREQQVLSSLTKGYSFVEISDNLFVSPHTITSHVKHIYRKLAVKSRGEAVYEAVQLGLVSYSDTNRDN